MELSKLFINRNRLSRLDKDGGNFVKYGRVGTLTIE
jgi:hypothetical protein